MKDLARFGGPSLILVAVVLLLSLGVLPPTSVNAEHLVGGSSGGAHSSSAAIVNTVVPTSGKVTCPYLVGTPGCVQPHRGLDISGVYSDPGLTGPPVYALAAGTTVKARCTVGYGWYVVIDHGDVGEGAHLYSLYGHMGAGDGNPATDDCQMPSWIEKEIAESRPVTKGQRIGSQGASGWATGTHLHLEIFWYPGAYRGGCDSITTNQCLAPHLCIGGGNREDDEYRALEPGRSCPPSASLTPPSLQIEAQLGPCLAATNSAWHYDLVNGWRGFFPGAPPSVQRLTEFVPGGIYFVNASGGCTISQGANNITLSRGWNIFVWR